MKTLAEIDAIMQTIPERYRSRWCEAGLCACLGCVQIANRACMAEAVTGRPFQGDPEHISESRIPTDIYDRLKITKEEWQLWMSANK